MEMNKKTSLLFLLLAMLQVCTVRMDFCPSLPDNNFNCYGDYNRYITCEWNSTYESDHTDSECKLHAKRNNKLPSREYTCSCDLKPVNDSRQALKKCTLDFGKDGRFGNMHVLTIHVNCSSVKIILTDSFKPVCHIKLDPPGKPEINFTTIMWLPQVKEHKHVLSFTSQLQWKKQDQSWNNGENRTKDSREEMCETELDEDSLEKGETYEARVRIKADWKWGVLTWSDWSPTASWVSPVGRTKPPASSPLERSVSVMVITGTIFAWFLAFILYKNDKATWVFILQKIKGSPLPDPGKSFLKDANFQNWMSSHFSNSKLIQSSLKAEEIISVEITSTVDAITPSRKEAAPQEKMKSSNESTSSSFSNPSYSQLCPSPSVSVPTMGKPDPSSSDTPNGSVGSEGEGKTAEQDRVKERRKELEIIQLLSKGNSNSEPVEVISDYEKVEKLQVEHFRLQSLDSGMCSGEDVSEESLEADSISVTDNHDADKEEERRGLNGKVDFQKLFGGCGNVFGKGSIQVCSDYEQVQKLEPRSPELPSLDSGVSSGGEEQVSHEESLEDIDKSTESTRFLFPPPASCALPCSLLSFPQLPLKFSGAGLCPALQPPSHILGGVAPMSMSWSMEPSGDGYMPVRQEES